MSVFEENRGGRKRANFEKAFGLIVSVKWSCSNTEQGSMPGMAVYYRPKSSGYTVDFREAGIYTKERAMDIIGRCSGEISFLEISGQYKVIFLRHNKNPIEDGAL